MTGVILPGLTTSQGSTVNGFAENMQTIVSRTILAVHTMNTFFVSTLRVVIVDDRRQSQNYSVRVVNRYDRQISLKLSKRLIELHQFFCYHCFLLVPSPYPSCASRLLLTPTSSKCSYAVYPANSVRNLRKTHIS